MPKVNFNTLITELIGQTVERPNRVGSGTLAGHAAGEPFEKSVLAILRRDYPGKIFKQYEFLNDLYLKHPQHITTEDKHELIDSPTAQFLLYRGDAATARWTPANLFDERQNETADILYFERGFYNIIDVKTRNLDKRAQPSNIISSYKLAQMCALMIENEEFDTVGIDYIGVDWREDKVKQKLICEAAQHVDLFRTEPSDLYINWGAGLQIQFHPNTADQSWQGSRRQWAREYLRHFVGSARRRCQTMQEKFINPFLKYID